MKRGCGWMRTLILACALAPAWPLAWAEVGAEGEAAAAAAAAADAGEYKLTLGRYNMSSDAVVQRGTDLNLRWRRDGRSLWLGVYRQVDVGQAQIAQQWRAGWDDAWDLAAISQTPALPVQVLPSLQLASGGFVAGSLALQLGTPYYVQVGLSRTNLRPYANLNFDPNDAIGLVLGWQGEAGRQLAVSVIADDRLGTGQRHEHLTLRWPLADSLRLSADLLHKQGQGETGFVKAWGWTLGLDGAVWFARLARDPKQNFSAQDAWRLSGGRRF